MPHLQWHSFVVGLGVRPQEPVLRSLVRARAVHILHVIHKAQVRISNPLEVFQLKVNYSVMVYDCFVVAALSLELRQRQSSLASIADLSTVPSCFGVSLPVVRNECADLYIFDNEIAFSFFEPVLDSIQV